MIASRTHRALRWVAAVALAVASLLIAAPAHAAADSIDEMTVTQTIDANGVMHVSETIVWRFGTSSGRHGINRYLVTREAYDDESDAVYTVSNIKANSPSGAAADVSTSTVTAALRGKV